MVEIIVARNAGFCEGVQRALKIALRHKNSKRPVYMLGNLVHNKQVVKKLKVGGIHTVKSLAQIPAGSRGILLISAHGTGPQTYERAKALGLKIVDTTCPWVKRAQILAVKTIEKGASLVILGDLGHPEVKGIVNWSRGLGKVIENAREVKSLGFDPDKEIALIAQTTQSKKEFDAAIAEMEKYYCNLTVHKTICGATGRRQKAALEIAGKTDLMLVIGDILSANSRRLTKLCRKVNPNTHQIETGKDFKKSWGGKAQKIGISAGASTPGWVIEAVLKTIKE